MSRAKWQKSKIDLEQLKIEIQRLKKTQNLYKLLKSELTKLEHWKNLKRGKPRKFKKVGKGLE
ncbi:MAG: hypothetical protein WC389_12895 [Lutibacter sp.]|jgi:hypothetical protein